MNDFTAMKDDFRDVLRFLPKLIRTPKKSLEQIPPFNAVALAIVLLATSAVCGFLSGLIDRSFWTLIGHTFLYPISTAVTLSLATCLLYVVFLKFFNKDVPLHFILVVLMLAAFPPTLLRIFSVIPFPIELVSLWMMCSVSAHAFSFHLKLPPQLLRRLFLGFFSAIVLIWMIQYALKNTYDYKWLPSIKSQVSKAAR